MAPMSKPRSHTDHLFAAVIGSAVQPPAASSKGCDVMHAGPVHGRSVAHGFRIESGQRSGYATPGSSMAICRHSRLSGVP